MIIREATKNDVNRISDLIKNVTINNPNNYSEEQKRVWIKSNIPSKIKNQLKDSIIFCAIDSDELIGTITLKNNYILGFYVSYNHIGNGIGTKLLSYLERYAIKKKIKKLYLTSTQYGIPFYRNRGYKTIKNVNTLIQEVEYFEVEMEKIID